MRSVSNSRHTAAECNFEPVFVLNLEYKYTIPQQGKIVDFIILLRYNFIDKIFICRKIPLNVCYLFYKKK